MFIEVRKQPNTFCNYQNKYGDLLDMNVVHPKSFLLLCAMCTMEAIFIEWFYSIASAIDQKL